MLRFLVLLVVITAVLAAGKTHYDVLKVSRTASDAEIKKAYRNLAKKYHPDKLKHSKKVEFVGKQEKERENEKFIEVSKAYELLSDERQRRQYDEELRFGGSAGQQTGSRFHRDEFQHFTQQYYQRRSPFGQEERVDVDDILRGFYNKESQQRNRGERGSFSSAQSSRRRNAGGQTIYMFRGPDGRTYYSTNPGQGQQGEEQNDIYSMIQTVLTAVLVPILQLFFVCMCFCQGTRTLWSLFCNGDSDNSDATHNKTYRRAGNTSQDPAQATKSLLPTFTLDTVVNKKSVIHVLALSNVNTRRLARCRLKFRADPIIFNDAVNIEEEEKRFILTILGDYFATNPDQEPADKNVDNFLVATCKGGSKYCILNLNQVEPASTASEVNEGEADTKPSDDAVHMRALQDWLERMVEGRVNWEASF